jgi:hypothetical protein
MEIEILAHLTSQTEQTGTHLAGMPFLNGGLRLSTILLQLC